MFVVLAACFEDHIDQAHAGHPRPGEYSLQRTPGILPGNHARSFQAREFRLAFQGSVIPLAKGIRGTVVTYHSGFDGDQARDRCGSIDDDHGLATLDTSQERTEAVSDLGDGRSHLAFTPLIEDAKLAKPNTPYKPSLVAEIALAHVGEDKAVAAYARSDLFECRREPMNAWSDYVAGRTA